MGADDYLTKDISLPHLLARIAALFRRNDLLAQPQLASDILNTGKLSMDAKRMTVSWTGTPLELTVTEFWMLHAIAKHAGHVKSRQQFMALQADFDCIETVYGMGYRWKCQ
jgi:two-component system OmpR family response regulator